MKQYLFALVLLFLLHPNCTQAQGKANLLTRRLCFIENKGQVTDQFGNARNDIQFKLSAGKGLNVFVGNGEMHYQWYKEASSKSSKIDEPGHDQKNTSSFLSEKSVEVLMQRMDVKLLGANHNAEIIREEKQIYQEHYYTYPLGDYGAIANSYKKITYKNIYPHIDWILYVGSRFDHKANSREIADQVSNEGTVDMGGFEYDFVVHEGGDVRDIQLKYGGADKLGLDEEGDITANTKMGAVTEHAPYSYDEGGKTVRSEFVLKNRILSFHTEHYKGTLTIDPAILAWSTYFGGSGTEHWSSSACDTFGNVYLAGSTTSTSNIATTGAYQTSYAGNYDAYIAKFSSGGALRWATYFGGAGDDDGDGITCDRAGNVFLAGVTTSSSNIASSSAYQTVHYGAAGQADAYIAKFDSGGNKQWSTYYGSGSEQMYEQGIVACDSFGNVYICGSTDSPNHIATSGAYQTIKGANSSSTATDIFLAKFSGSGSILWATYFGGYYAELDAEIACDGANVFLGGQTASDSNIATIGAYQDTLGLGGFLAKFGNAGSVIWATYYTFVPSALACDLSGNVYFGGSFNTMYCGNSNYNFITPGCYQSTCVRSALAKFSPLGIPIWATFFGGNNTLLEGISCDHSENVYLTGYTSDNSGIATIGSYQTSCDSCSISYNLSDAFLVKFTPSGQRWWGTYFGGTGIETNFYGVCSDNSGNVYITGQTNSTSHIATAGAYQSTLGGGWDNYLAKFGIDTSVMISNSFTDTLFCAGDTFSVPSVVSSNFQSSNTFTVQLSDSSGSFASVVNIGMANTNTAGSISCTIPFNTIAGIHYRIRIVSSSPMDTSEYDGFSIHIKAIPYHSLSSNSPLCTGDSLHLNDTASSVSSFTWNGPNSFNSTSANNTIVSVTLNDSGEYYVTDTFQNGCHITDSIFVSLHVKPAKPFASSNGPICAGDSLQFAVSNLQSGLTYSWTGPNSFTSAVQNAVRTNVTVSDSGKYIVKAILNGCISKPDTIDVNIDPLVTPTVSISSLPAIIPAGHTDTFTANATNCPSPTYQWFRNNVLIPGATSNPYIDTLGAGQHMSVVVHCGACASPDSAGSNSLTTTGIPPNPLKGEFAVWPNPVGSVLHVETTEDAHVNITSIEGKVLIRDCFVPSRSGGTSGIKIDELARGVYFLEVVYEDGSRDVRKVIKE